MGVEIERKFLLRDERWREDADAGERMRQGYLSADTQCSVRVRLVGAQAFLGIKSAASAVRRLEFEFPIPLDDARQLLNQVCLPAQVDKTRYRVPVGRHVWEIDVFEGDNAGLVVAEIELDDEDEAFERPAWLGEEVSHDPRYFNMNLAVNPFSRWS